MKYRLLVMNGQRILEAERAGTWIRVRVEEAGAVSPGLYNLYLARPGVAPRTYEGPVLHDDGARVYQYTRSGMIAHRREKLDKLPAPGASVVIHYEADGRARVMEP